jgi:glycosyltransferase involved in cell wall biosynthesis
VFSETDFERLRGLLEGIQGRFIMSINDTPEIRAIFAGFAIEEVGVNYRLSGKVTPARELIISGRLPLDWLDATPQTLSRAGAGIAALAAREDADIIQTCSAALLADTEFDMPCVAVQHSCVASWWAAVKGTPLPSEFAWQRELVEAGLNRASAVVAPSVAFAAETARIYDLARPVLPVHNGKAAPPVRALPEGQFVFTAGRLWDVGKNVATLDAAAARIELPFQAAGPIEGPNGASVHPRHLQLVGELRSTRISALMAARPVFASAAIYEPFGLSVLEAAQAGCALVLSDIATHRELWDGAAIFVPARDADAFAGAIQSLFDDPERRHALGQAASAHARLYTPERMAGRMAEIYARVVEPVQLAGAA